MSVDALNSQEPRRRREQANWRREQLLQAAVRVFADRGVEAASVKDVAAEAGVAPGLLHHYFGRKEALVVAVIERFGFLDDLRGLLKDAMDRPASDVLVAVVREFGALLESRADLITIFFTGMANPQVRASLDAHLAEGQRLLGGYLSARIAAGELRIHDTLTAAQLLLSSVVFGQLSGHPPEPMLLVDLVLEGLLTDANR